MSSTKPPALGGSGENHIPPRIAPEGHGQGEEEEQRIAEPRTGKSHAGNGKRNQRITPRKRQIAEAERERESIAEEWGKYRKGAQKPERWRKITSGTMGQVRGVDKRKRPRSSGGDR